MEIPRSPGRQVLPNAVPNGRVRLELDHTAGARGLGRVTQELRGLGEDAQRFLLEEQERADRLALTAADNDLAARETALLYDKDKGLFNRRKRNALGIGVEARQAHETELQTVLKGLTTARQREAFQARGKDRQNDIARAANQHEAVEVRRWDDEVLETAIAAGQDEAARAGVDELLASGKVDRIQKAIIRSQGALLSHGERNGVDPAAAELLSARVASKSHRAVIGRLVGLGKPLAAQEYTERFRKEILAEDLLDVERNLQQGDTLGASQVETDRIMEAHGEDRRAAMAEARKIEDPKARAATEQAVWGRFQQQEVEVEEAYQNDFAASLKRIQEGATPGAQNVLEEVGPTLMAKMRPKEEAALTKYWKAKRGLAAIETDPRAYTAFYALTDRERAKLKPAQMQALIAVLDEEDYKAATKKWSADREAAASGGYGTIYSTDELMLQYLQESKVGGIKPGDTLKKISEDEAKSKTWVMFKKDYDRRLEAWKADTGEKATESERKGILEGMLREEIDVRGAALDGYSVGSWLFKNKPDNVKKRSFEIQKGDRVPLDLVGPEVLTRIKNEILAREAQTGVKYSEELAEQVAALWKAGREAEAIRLVEGK